MATAKVHQLRAAAVGVGALVVAFAVVLRVGLLDSFVARAVDDLGQAGAAALAGAVCSVRAVRTSGRWRASWLLMAAALGSWAVGELIWSGYELLSDRETPFPSFADLGFLGFPVLALVALLARPGAAFVGRGRVAVVLDGTMVAASLFVVSWSTSLGAVYHAGASDNFSFVVSLAYPAGDLVLLTVAMLVLVRMRARAGLLVLAAGLTLMALADSGFTYLTAAGTYQTGAWVDVAWFAGFLVMGLSALIPQDEVDMPQQQRVQSTFGVALPYVLVLIATLAEIVGLLRQSAAPVTLIVIAAALAALVVRQLLVVLDNRRLALDVMAQQEELTHRAFHDPLTGLANRALFYDRVTHALDLHHRDLRPVSVMFVDLDDFKSINDAFGHDAGDAVLSAVAERLRAVVRTGDTIARLGGDEFAVLLEDDGNAGLLAARLLEALMLPVAISDRDVPVRASIGTATLDPAQPRTDIQDLLKRADLAMYAAKRRGKGTAVAFSPALRKGAEDDLELRIALHEDVRIGRIGTAFQPIVHAATGELYALEALARWDHRGRAVSPDEFIPLADRGGFLADLDLLVARSALGVAASPECAAGQVIVSTNVGLTRMSETDLPRRLRALLHESRVAPGRLVVEVSEQDLLDEAGTVAALGALRELGVCLAIDDFGVGYSNLSRLEALAPDIVKLDRSFVAPLADADAPVKLLRRVIELAHDLGAVVVGEGVETQRQRDTLAALGCDAVQGFLIGVPASRAVEAAVEAV